MSNIKYKVILFDNDGTIADTEEAIMTSIKYTMKKILGIDNLDVDEFKTLIGLPSHDQFIHYTKDEDKIQEMIDTYRAHNDTVLYKQIKNFDGLPQVFDTLTQRGYFLGIVTSKRHDICLRGLKTLGIDKYFDYLQGCDDWPEHKPNPGTISHAFDMLQVQPEEVIYIGDSIYDIQAGNNAGCDTCAVLWGTGTPDALKAENPKFIVEKPSDLLSLF